MTTRRSEAGEEEHRPARPLELRRLVQRAVLALPVVLFAAAGWAHRWIVDDGFIYLRVVEQITSGNGPVFNAGERVEAFTSPSWVALLTLADVLTPLRAEWLSVLLGILASGAGVGLAIAASARAVRRGDASAFVVPFGVLVPMAILPMWIFQTSGLETGLVFGWLGLCSWVLAGWADSERGLAWHAAVVVGLGWLVRPELGLFSAVLLAAVLVAQWPTDGWPARGRLVAVALAAPLVYQVFRMGYYGAIVSNPAIAKEASETHFGRGWDYLVDFVSPYWLWLAALVVVLGGYVPLVADLVAQRRRREIASVAAFVVAGGLHALYVVAVGGDWMHARLLLPALFAFALPVAVVPADRRHAVGLLLAPWLVAATLWLRPPQAGPRIRIGQPFTLANAQAGKVTTDDYRWGRHGPRRKWFVGDEYYYGTGFTALAKISVGVLDPPAPQLRLPVANVGGIGLISYAIGPDLYVFDRLGLANVIGARLTTAPSNGILPRKPGHEKPLPSVWAAAMLTGEGAHPDPAHFPDSRNPLILPPEGEAFQEKVVWARAALACPQVQTLLESVRAPLTPGRFVSNLLHSFGNTTLRLPNDPREAYESLCGGAAASPATDAG